MASPRDDAGPTADAGPPDWFSFPPFFTLQPVRESRERQTALWKEYILGYCRQKRVWALSVEEDSPLFCNAALKRKLSLEARRLFLAALAEEGRVEWTDRLQTRCLVHWRRPAEWAKDLHRFVRDHGLEDTVTTFHELATGDDMRGADFHGMDLELLRRVVRLLEAEGLAKVFKGASSDDEGVKFFSGAGAAGR